VSRNVLHGLPAMLLICTTAIGCHAPAASPPPPRVEAIVAPRNGATLLEVLPIARTATSHSPAPDVSMNLLESYPFTIPLPANVACKLEDATKSPPSVELGLSREGPGFGVMRARSLVARIGVGEREMVIDAEGTGLKLRAIAIEGSLDLYAASPITFESLLVSQPYAELGVVSGASGGIETSLALPKQISMPKRKALTARVPCANLRLQQTKFDALAAVGTAIDVAYLLPDATALSTIAGGAAVAMLHPRGASPEVQVLARRGRHTQIAWEVGEVVAVGWVDRSRLRPTPLGDDEFGAGGLSLSGVGEGSRRTLRCDGDVPLRAQVGSRTEIIGVVLPQTPIEIERERPYAFEVDLPSTGLDRHEKGVLLVDQEHVSSCRD
jgi:hypothetical protein